MTTVSLAVVFVIYQIIDKYLMFPTANIFMMAIPFVVWYFSNLCFSGIDANINFLF